MCSCVTPRLHVENLRNTYEDDVGIFVQHGFRLHERLVAARPASKGSEKVLKLRQYVEEGNKALVYMKSGRVPSPASLELLELAITRVHKASIELQVGRGMKKRISTYKYYNTARPNTTRVNLGQR